MSFFRKFKLPQLVRRGKSEHEVVESIPRFNCNDLAVKQRIGQGAFGDVYTTDYKGPGDARCETVVVKKMLQVLDQEEKKLFFKEVELLNELQHTNIVRLRGVCCQPLAMMLDYVYFDFTQFDQDVRVSSLSDFLLQIDEYNCEGFCNLINHAAKEIINGLSYLHSKGIAHRDLKPANILVSNQHYSALSDADDILQQYSSRPIACKLTDFGESRSQLVQTQSFLASKTNNVDRGTVVYMAPEILVEKLRITGATISDLFLVDIWALGMIIFAMINPNLKHPFRLEIRSAGSISSQEGLKKFICSQLSQRKHPLPDKKYEVERATVWIGLESVYRGCVDFDRTSRLSLKDAGEILSEDNERASHDLDVFPLKVSQATAVQQFDERIAIELNETERKDPQQLESSLTNDGTNACSFFSVKIADRILSESFSTGGDFFADLAKVAEETIWQLPTVINEHRDVGKMYDAMEAYDILNKQQILTSSYDFSEELPFADTVFSYDGRQKLHSKLHDLGKNDFVAIFTSEPLVLTIGCLGGKPYIIDTHPATWASGNGNGLIMLGKDNSSRVWMSLCVWLWRRLNHGSVKPDAYQSLTVMTRQSK